MYWVIAAAAVGLLVVAPIVGVVEARRRRKGPTDVGFWVFARSVAGSVHLRWGHAQSPVVRFELPRAEGRVRVEPAGDAQRIALRAHLSIPAGFAGRICAPPEPPLRWRTPGLKVIDDAAPGCSVESNHAAPMQAFLSRGAVREALTHLLEELPGVELLVNHQVATLETRVRAVSAGAALDVHGAALIDALRIFVAALLDLADTRAEAGERASGCAACAGELGSDPQVCRGCGSPLHRGCRATLEGCVAADCPEAADALPGRAA